LISFSTNLLAKAQHIKTQEIELRELVTFHSLLKQEADNPDFHCKAGEQKLLKATKSND